MLQRVNMNIYMLVSVSFKEKKKKVASKYLTAHVSADWLINK